LDDALHVLELRLPAPVGQADRVPQARVCGEADGVDVFADFRAGDRRDPGARSILRLACDFEEARLPVAVRVAARLPDAVIGDGHALEDHHAHPLIVARYATCKGV
jgi:hypothetical protein